MITLTQQGWLAADYWPLWSTRRKMSWSISGAGGGMGSVAVVAAALAVYGSTVAWQVGFGDGWHVLASVRP